MSQTLISLFENKVLVSTLIAWIFAQCVKVILGVIREKKFNFGWFIGTGGFPSSHASGASALAVSCGFLRILGRFVIPTKFLGSGGVLWRV